MLNERVLGTAVVTTVNGAAQEMNISPFFPRHKVRARLEFTGFSGTVLIEGSDDNSSWSTLYTTGALTTLTGTKESGEIIAKRYMRHGTTRSAGTMDKAALQAAS